MINKSAEFARAVKARDGGCVSCRSQDGLIAHRKQGAPRESWWTLEHWETLCKKCYRTRDGKVRVRKAKRPQRKTLERQISDLKYRVLTLEEERARVLDIVRRKR